MAGQNNLVTLLTLAGPLILECFRPFEEDEISPGFIKVPYVGCCHSTKQEIKIQGVMFLNIIPADEVVQGLMIKMAGLINRMRVHVPANQQVLQSHLARSVNV